MPSQVFFITGTSSGFGNELVKKCLKEGDKVVATSRNSSKLYCASKWAIEGLTETISKEIKPEWNIYLTNIEPSGFRTEWAGGSMEFADRHPIRPYQRQGEHEQETGARAFWDVAKMDKPPIRVAIGSDAYGVIEQKLKD